MVDGTSGAVTAAQRTAVIELKKGSLIRVSNGWSGRGRPVVSTGVAKILLRRGWAVTKPGIPREELTITDAGYEQARQFEASSRRGRVA